LIEAEKATRLEAARVDRLSIRAIEFKPFWDSLVTEISSTQEQIVIPPFVDARELPTVAEMLAEDNAHKTVTEERFLAIKDAILVDVFEYQTRLKHRLVQYIISTVDISVAAQDSKTEEMDLSILARASTLFRCPGSWTCKALLPYPDIFFHQHVRDTLKTFVSYGLSRLRPPIKVTPTAIQILKALGLPEDTPAIALNDLNGRFMCLCGHPDFQKPVDFGKIVSHFIAENEWYDTITRQPNFSRISRMTSSFLTTTI